MGMDFTLQKYSQFCAALTRLSCPVMTVKRFLEMGQPQCFSVVLRHDVDRSFPSALRMAHLEASYGISSSYYVRMTPSVFRPSDILKLYLLGHEVGYHYEVLAKTRGNTAQALDLFEDELKELRQVVPIATASMHGSPLSPWNNLDLWQAHDFKDYNLLGEFSLSLDNSKLYYLTDTGRTWDTQRYNLRDHINAATIPSKIHSTDQLIEFLKKNVDLPVVINIHPNRWSHNFPYHLFNFLLDSLSNQAKWFVSVCRKHQSRP